VWGLSFGKSALIASEGFSMKKGKGGMELVNACCAVVIRHVIGIVHCGQWLTMWITSDPVEKHGLLVELKRSLRGSGHTDWWRYTLATRKVLLLRRFM